MKIIIPGNPPSTNHLYYFARGHGFMKKEGKEYKEFAANIFREHFKKPIEKNVIVCLSLFFSDHRKRDIDNYNKVAIDSMNGIAFKDDCQIMKLIIEKSYDKKNPRVEVEVTEC